MNYLIVPGLNNSGPRHWQSFWAKSLPNATRVVQRCWDKPQKEEWIETLDKAVRNLGSDTIIVAHSLGVATTVMWLTQKAEQSKIPSQVKGAFLVSPSDVDNIEIIKSFAPMPLQKLSVPACVVASENDPFVSMERALFFANAWGVPVFNAGALGHINSDSDLGEWEQGRQFLAEFERTIF
jgi:predicted alpha/beta hydrolase family esterase